MSTLDDFFGNDARDSDDMLDPAIATAAAADPEYPDAPATGRYSSCWTTMSDKPALGQRILAGRYWYVVSQVGEWQTADPENGTDEAGWFVRMISPAA